jgi:hypothetical protein
MDDDTIDDDDAAAAVGGDHITPELEEQLGQGDPHPPHSDQALVDTSLRNYYK